MKIERPARSRKPNRAGILLAALLLAGVPGCGREDPGEPRSDAPEVETTSPATTLPGDATEPAPPLDRRSRDAAASDDGVQWTRYRHPEGFSFRHPRKWDLKPGDDVVVLIPGDAEKDASGEPLETFIVGGQEAEGVRRPDDPAVMQFFAQQFPRLRRAGDTESLGTSLGRGVVFRLEGSVKGREIVTTIYVVLHEDLGLFLAHVATRESAERRRGIARKIFSSFAWGTPRIDEALVGVWTRTRSSGSDVTSSGYIGSSTSRTWRFGSDGRFTYGATSRIFGHVEGAGGQTTLDSGEDKGVLEGGRWYVQGNRLQLVWSDGSEDTYIYSVFPHTENRTALKLTLAGEKRGDFFIKRR